MNVLIVGGGVAGSGDGCVGVEPGAPDAERDVQLERSSARHRLRARLRGRLVALGVHRCR